MCCFLISRQEKKCQFVFRYKFWFLAMLLLIFSCCFNNFCLAKLWPPPRRWVEGVTAAVELLNGGYTSLCSSLFTSPAEGVCWWELLVVEVVVQEEDESLFLLCSKKRIELAPASHVASHSCWYWKQPQLTIYFEVPLLMIFRVVANTGKK